MVVAAAPATETATTQATASATSTSPGGCPSSANSSLFAPTHTPMMTQVGSTLFVGPCGTQASIFRGYPSCRAWICASKRSVPKACSKTSVHIISLQTASTSTEIPIKVSWLEKPSTKTPARLKAAPVIGFPTAPESKQAIARTKSARSCCPAAGRSRTAS
jgi:hypothetical protein